MNQKKKKSGAENVQLKQKNLLEAAGKAPNQKSLHDFLKAPLHLEEIDDSNASEFCRPESHEDSAVHSLETLNFTLDENKRRTSTPVKSDVIPSESSEPTGISSHYTAFSKDFGTNTSLLVQKEQQTVFDSIIDASDVHELNIIHIEFQRPEQNSASKLQFMKLHPIHPDSCRLSALFVRKCGNATVPRNWLSYNIFDDKFYCSVCMAFSDYATPFKDGTKLDSKRGSSKVVTHETSKSHITAANIWMQMDSSKTVDSLLNHEQNFLRLTQIKKNQEIVKSIINWILCLGRQGIAYRGETESLKYFKDNSTNHGNFLEILRTASQHDSLLETHLDKCVDAAIRADVNYDKGPKGRGSALSFISKTTVNKLIHIIADEIRKLIVAQVKKARIFSIMTDSTRDIVGHEQCAVVLRYVNSDTFNVEEKFVGMIRLMNASGEGYFDSIIPFLKNLGVDTSLMVGSSFDGASNMRSDDVGLQGRLKQLNNDHVYTWCYGHVLNLGVTDSTECVSSARNLFGLLQTTHNFCTASYKRVGEWEKLTAKLRGPRKLIRLEGLGKTRWFSKERALTKIFGSFSNPSSEVYAILLQFLKTINKSTDFDPKVSLEAGFLLESWTKIETLLTSFAFLQIFEIIGPTSRYFQTRGLDLLTAWRKLQSSIHKIDNLRGSFEDIKNKALAFAKNVNETAEDVDVELEFPSKRIRRVKRLPGELASDEPIEDDWENYRVNQFLVIYDLITQGLRNRYAKNNNEVLIKEIAFFHPSKFADLPAECLKFSFLSRILQIDENTLIHELKDFAETFIEIVKPNIASRHENPTHSCDEELDDDEEFKCQVLKKQCNNCVKCCFSFLLKFNFHVSAYTNVYRVYEYFLTLPCAQVECERSFSKLKIIKSRLRSSLKQDLLEPLLLMYVERELTYLIDVDKILRLYASSSPELTRNLIE